MRLDLPGSKSRAKAHLGFPRNVGDPVVSTDKSGKKGSPGNSQKTPGLWRWHLAPHRSEPKMQPWYRQTKETKCGGMGGRES